MRAAINHNYHKLLKLFNKIPPMKTTNNPSQKNYNNKVAPVSCYCKLSLLVVHLQYLNEKRKLRTRTSMLPGTSETQNLFHQYI